MTENSTNPNVLSLHWFKEWNFQCNLKCSFVCAWYKEFLLIFKAVILLCKFGLLCHPLVPQNASSDSPLVVWGTEPVPFSAKEGIGVWWESCAWEAHLGLADEWL